MTPRRRTRWCAACRQDRRHVDKIIALSKTDDLDDAEVVVVSYGITSRVAQRAIDMAREQGMRVGKFRIISAWPFPEQQIRELAGQVKAFVVPELNLGQMVHEVERCAGGKAKTDSRRATPAAACTIPKRF